MSRNSVREGVHIASHQTEVCPSVTIFLRAKEESIYAAPPRNWFEQRAVILLGEEYALALAALGAPTAANDATKLGEIAWVVSGGPNVTAWPALGPKRFAVVGGALAHRPPPISKPASGISTERAIPIMPRTTPHAPRARSAMRMAEVRAVERREAVRRVMACRPDKR
jgi:hypothetical protein